jgi:hypothetical protein
VIGAGLSAHRIYQQCFSNARVCRALSDLLAGMDVPAHNAQ